MQSFAYLSFLSSVLGVCNGSKPDLLFVQNPLVLHFRLAQLLVLHFCYPVLQIENVIKESVRESITCGNGS